MITKFKIFENISILPKIDDYVIINPEEFVYSHKILYSFFLNLPIGQIINTKTAHGGTELTYQIKFEDVPNEVAGSYFDSDNSRYFTINYFNYWSSNKEEIGAITQAKKYNL